jgi:hypothetical protein
MQFEKHLPKNGEEHWHEIIMQAQFQQDDDVCVLWHHFVGECGDKKHDEECHKCQSIYGSGIHHPNQTELI